MNSATVNLIATDPPFNKDVKAFKARDGTAADGQSFTDKWWWDPGNPDSDEEGIHDRWLKELAAYDEERGAAVKAVVEAAKLAQGYDTAAYLCWLGVRLMEMHRILAEDGSIYLHCDHTAGAWIKALMDAVFGREQFRNDVIWYYKNASRGKRQWDKSHDVLLWYSASAKYCFNREAVLAPYESGMTAWRYAQRGKDPPEGKTPDNVIVMPALNTMDKERTGWTTQKPLALYERIILASSNPGDLVFDPFCGCATTLVAAAKHGREWLGCDLDPTAQGVVRERLSDSRQLANAAEVRILHDVPVRTDDAPEAAPNLVLRPARPKERALPRAGLLTLLTKRDGLLCQGCGLHPVEGLPMWKLESLMHIDHRTPRAEGGSNHENNRVLLCSDCNLVKSDSMTLIGLRKHNRRNKRILGPVKEY